MRLISVDSGTPHADYTWAGQVKVESEKAKRHHFELSDQEIEAIFNSDFNVVKKRISLLSPEVLVSAQTELKNLIQEFEGDVNEFWADHEGSVGGVKSIAKGIYNLRLLLQEIEARIAEQDGAAYQKVA